MAEPTDAAYALVIFHPQVWHDEQAVTADDPKEFVVPIEDATDEDGQLLEDDSRDTDQLKHHENAPESAKQWDGPFYVTIDEVLPAALEVTYEKVVRFEPEMWDDIDPEQAKKHTLDLVRDEPLTGEITVQEVPPTP